MEHKNFYNISRVHASHSQFAIFKAFWQFANELLHFLKKLPLLKSDTSWIFRVTHWTSYIQSYFNPNKYPLLNNNVISQRFIVHINFKLHTSFISIILLRSNCKPVTSFNPIVYEFFKYFTNHRKKTNRMVIFSCRP